MDEDPFESLLSLEDEYYNEGHALGTADGKQAGHLEGRIFGLEKGFEKYLEMGRLQGRLIVWSSRLSQTKDQDETLEDTKAISTESPSIRGAVSHPQEHTFQSATSAGTSLLPRLPKNARLEKHIRTFHALVEPESLSTQNNEEAVSEFDDRLKRAIGKAKIIDKMLGEEGHPMAFNTISESHIGEEPQAATGNRQDDSIEEISNLRVRH